MISKQFSQLILLYSLYHMIALLAVSKLLIFQLSQHAPMVDAYALGSGSTILSEVPIKCTCLLSSAAYPTLPVIL
jgi:hypothetical protein